MRFPVLCNPTRPFSAAINQSTVHFTQAPKTLGDPVSVRRQEGQQHVLMGLAAAGAKRSIQHQDELLPGREYLVPCLRSHIDRETVCGFIGFEQRGSVMLSSSRVKRGSPFERRLAALLAALLLSAQRLIPKSPAFELQRSSPRLSFPRSSVPASIR